MRGVTPTFLFLSLFLSLPSIIFALPNQAELHFAVTSDLHGWVSTSYLYPRRKRMGLLHIEEAIQEQRSQYPELILLDAGDLLVGSPLTHYFHFHSSKPAQKDPFFQIVNRLGYDAISPGNHDFELNPLFEKEYVPQSNFSWIAANLKRREQMIFSPYLILNRGGLKVAVLGLTTPGTKMWVDPWRIRGIDFQSLRKAAKHWVPKIRAKENPDLLVVLVHSGVTARRDNKISKLNQVALANGVEDILREDLAIDLVFAGHDHRLFPFKTGRRIRRIRGVPVLEAGRWGEALLLAHLKLERKEKTWRVENVRVEVKKPKKDQKIDLAYRTLIPQSYWDYLEEESLWVMKKTKKTTLEECLNQLQAKAVDEEGIDGTLFPWIRVSTFGIRAGERLRRKNLFHWIRYGNTEVTIKLSLRDVQLLSSPFLLRKEKKGKSNQFLYPWIKKQSLSLSPSLEKQSWWLSKKDFAPRYWFKLGNYHVNGGGGMIARLFLDKEREKKYGKIPLRELLFQFLSSPRKVLPTICPFLPKTSQKKT